MQIVLKRIAKREEYTIGSLYLLEDEDMDVSLDKNEKQERCVKEGEMRVGWLSSSYYWLVRLINKIEDAKGRGEAVWIPIV